MDTTENQTTSGNQLQVNDEPGAATMDDERFWAMIEWADEQSNGDMKKKYWCLYVQILQLPAEEAVMFAAIYDRHYYRSDTYPMCEAGDILVNGIGNDGFDDFRAAVLSMGKKIYERALDDPDTLVEIYAGIETWLFESYSYAVMQAVEQVTGSYPPATTPKPEKMGGTPCAGPIEERFPRLFWWAKGRHNACE
jgi:hypothetical protein